jgi:hypothetical protein
VIARSGVIAAALMIRDRFPLSPRYLRPVMRGSSTAQAQEFAIAKAHCLVNKIATATPPGVIARAGARDTRA